MLFNTFHFVITVTCTVQYGMYNRVEWICTFSNFRNWTHCCRSGIIKFQQFNSNSARTERLKFFIKGNLKIIKVFWKFANTFLLLLHLLLLNSFLLLLHLLLLYKTWRVFNFFLLQKSLHPNVQFLSWIWGHFYASRNDERSTSMWGISNVT